MEQHKILEHDKLWSALKISPTYSRTQVLKILLNRTQEFSIDDICEERVNYNLTLSKTAVSNIMRLFHVRGLLVQSGERRGPARGRPELLFKISPVFRDVSAGEYYQ
jgi:predicted ArsR family transcriptional regulator